MGPALFNVAGRILISMIVVTALMLGLGWVNRVNRLFLASQNNLRNPPPVIAGKPASAVPSRPPDHPFWPEFPHNDPGTFQGCVIDGVPVLIEEWNCQVTAEEVFSFYRQQMSAWGWKDVTEETYGLGVALQKADERQTESFVDLYQSIVSSNLVFSYGTWNLHIAVQASPEIPGHTVVSLYAAADSSVQKIMLNLTQALADKTQVSHPVEILQESGGEHYRTTLMTKTAPPGSALREALENLGSRGWRPVMSVPGHGGRFSHFVWLERNKHYAALSVSVLSQGGGSSLTLVEIL